MSTTIDRLETVYTARDDYSSKVDRMIAKTRAFDKAFAKATGGGGFSKIASAFSSVGGGVVGALSKGAELLAAFGVAAGVAGVAAGTFAVQSALDFDTMTRKLEAFLGSAEEAGRAMQFIQGLAGPSIFESSALAEAGTLLAAYGLNIQKVLPLADKLASAMGGGAESVSEVARVFGRLKSGDFGEAFERLRDFGISFDDLKGKGLQFSKSNEFLGTKLQALAAVSSIVEEKFGRISQIMQDSPAAKFASLMDSVRMSAIQAGQVFLTALAPGVERVTRLFQFLTEQGVFTKIAQGLVGVGNSINAAFGSQGMRAVFVFIAALESLPDIFRNVVKTLAAGFDSLVTALTGPFKPLLQIIEALTGKKFDIAGTVTGALAGLSDKALGTNWGEMSGKIGGRADALQKAFSSHGAGSSPTLGDPFGSFTANDSALNQTMKGVEANTKLTADNTRSALDLRRFALGGGDIGQMGITAVERFGNNRGGTIKVEMNSSVRDKIVEAMTEVAQQVLENAGRQGLLGN